MVVVAEGVLDLYPRFSLYNSPYVAHDEGCAIDLYPQSEADRNSTERATAAPSPVAGEVIATRTVSAPPKPYAVDHDHLVVVDTGEHLARMLHVDPGVEPGDEVAVGDSLGEMVRSGFFAPWVDNHIHLGFRERDANPFRASGSLPVEVGVEPIPVAWDGRGTVVERADTYVVLDSPDHPAPGERFAGVACDEGGVSASEASRGSSGEATESDGVLDGGLAHYEGGGVLGAGGFGSGASDASETAAVAAVSLAGQRVGTAEGRTVAWDDVTVLANGTPITGVSLFCSRRAGFGVKLVCPDAGFEVGEEVEVRFEG
ncbi:hypothetical protein NGM10_07200 [Halorussus salilacus]|uniref:hypothetical protein n=1 Tax=Halorussus salilacus TaxID=2953750 RepID=UPI0020A038A3|nr:hypothetical protein [Halorussus salilacus]USZ69514.1 hypothetical protein NGM10_07200 [Halorussus salilacus]